MTELSEALRHKIKNVDELCQAIGPRPRRRTVVMCHGVFDLVPPRSHSASALCQERSRQDLHARVKCRSASSICGRSMC
jgi:hypothetical protein